MSSGGGFKRSSAEWVSKLLSDPKTRKKVLDYLQSEEFKGERQRLKDEAVKHARRAKSRYRSRNRTPEQAARERDLSIRLAEVEAEAAELRIRLSEVLEEEQRLREELREL